MTRMPVSLHFLPPGRTGRVLFSSFFTGAIIMSQTPSIAVVLDDDVVQSIVLQDWPDGIPLPRIAVLDYYTKSADDDEDLLHFSIGDEPVSALGYITTPEVYEAGQPILSPKEALAAIEAREAGHARVESSITNILAGYLRGDPARREQMQNFPDWSRMAGQELERRNTRFLETLSDEALNAIAQGEINLAKLAGKIPE
jgi:hypothetical protein